MGQLRLITTKRTMGFKLESSPYSSAETLTTADYDFSIEQIEYSTEIEETVRKLARADTSPDTSVMGRTRGTVRCRVAMHQGSAVNSAPQYFQMLRACALKQTAHGATGISLVPHSDYDRIPATIEVVERQEGASPKQLVVRFRGAMGNARLTSERVGAPIYIEFDFTGVWTATTTRAYASQVLPTNFDTALPDAVLSATTYFFGTTQFIGKFSIDLGNQVELFSDPTRSEGYDGARVINRDVVMEIDPDMVVTDDADHFTSLKNATTGAINFQIGDMLKISAPKGQIISAYNPGDREGHVTNEMRIRFIRDTNGNDEFEILQGSKS